MRFVANFNATAVADIQASQEALNTALQQVSTGKRVNVPGDDPAAAAALVQSLSASAKADQYTSNATTALNQVQTADAVLSSVVAQLNSAISVGTEGATGIITSTQKQALASEVQGLLTSVVSEANTTYAGLSLFGGTITGSTAFTKNGSGGYTYNGNDGVNYVSVGDTLNVQTNIPGDQLFQKSGSSVFGALEDLSTALTTGTSAQISAATVEVTTALNYVSGQRSVYGNSETQLNSQETFLSQETLTLSSQQSSLVGIDTATAEEALVSAETQNSAVLESAAKVLQTTLLDYLK